VASVRQELERATAAFEDSIVASGRREKTLQYACKRALDLVGAVVLIAVLVPPSLLVGLIIRLDSRGPVLLKQTRVGKYGRLFSVYKFRTMVDRADELVHSLKDKNEQDGPLFKMRADPRMTRVGRWLRKLSIDEWPQLINVARGDMSLVGPRPPLPREVQVYTRHQLGRLAAKPGMTGLWQVSGRSTLTFENMVDLDIEYITNWSLASDIWILTKTLPAVLSTRGAY
jgi:lipopolysaccharide/colanic/teichoic acid biosynthesis glycosyltransferase